MSIPALTKFLSIASPALAASPASFARNAPPEARDLLRARNGFYAFESALHVFHAGVGGPGPSVEEWNEPATWLESYAFDANPGLWFFAEDVFGDQFALCGGEVLTFQADTGEVEPFARDLEGWADRLLTDVNVVTGYPLAHAWQQQHGALSPGMRLVPKIPFVCGGEFALENLYACDAVRGMRLRGELARQIRDLPDGARVRFRIKP